MIVHISCQTTLQTSSIVHGEAENSTQEIEKYMIAKPSVLELHLKTKGHVFGAFVFHLLGMNRLFGSTRRLKVVLLWSAVILCSLFWFYIAVVYCLYIIFGYSSRKNAHQIVLVTIRTGDPKLSPWLLSKNWRSMVLKDMIMRLISWS
jgi:hypothetical protein